jgi:hypothetical protein
MTILDASYETSGEARLCLLCQNDVLEAENNHLRRQLKQSSNIQQTPALITYQTSNQNLVNRC